MGNTGGPAKQTVHKQREDDLKSSAIHIKLALRDSMKYSVDLAKRRVHPRG